MDDMHDLDLMRMIALIRMQSPLQNEPPRPDGVAERCGFRYVLAARSHTWEKRLRDHAWSALLVLAFVGSGLNAGLFFIFSNTIMRAFDRLPAAGAVAAMNSINRVILNPLFFLVFFGTALLCLVLLVSRLDSPLIVAGALFYLIGSIGVTMVRNVPLNGKLAKVSPSADDMEAQWRDYREPWTRWNHVRTVACLLAAAAFIVEIAR